MLILILLYNVVANVKNGMNLLNPYARVSKIWFPASVVLKLVERPLRKEKLNRDRSQFLCHSFSITVFASQLAHHCMGQHFLQLSCHSVRVTVSINDEVVKCHDNR